MAAGGSIGAGGFIGAGGSLAPGGPMAGGGSTAAGRHPTSGSAVLPCLSRGVVAGAEARRQAQGTSDIPRCWGREAPAPGIRYPPKIWGRVARWGEELSARPLL